eukprot:2013588-Pyramimonas_sp.AAC.2
MDPPPLAVIDIVRVSANHRCFSVNTGDVSQPPQSLTLRAAHDQDFRSTPLGTKDSRVRRSPPGLPALASTQLPNGSQPSVTRVSPRQGLVIKRTISSHDY